MNDQTSAARAAEQEPPVRQAEAARQEPASQSGEQPDAAPPGSDPGATGETQATDPAEGEPPLELPRSWTKDRAAHWAKLDRGTQEFLLDHDRKATAEVRRVQNEAAEQRKASDAERQKAEQAREHYETALPQVMAALQQQHTAAFADIKTYADVERLARADWPRYVLWAAQQKQLAGTKAQLADVTARQSQDRRTKLAAFATRESELFAQMVPAIADPVQGARLKDDAVATLREIGFTDAELGAMWRGEKELSLHDHRLQLLIRDGVRFRPGQTAPTKATRLPVPPVARPGTAQPHTVQQHGAAAAVVQNLTDRLNTTGSLKDAARLLAERRRAAK